SLSLDADRSIKASNAASSLDLSGSPLNLNAHVLSLVGDGAITLGAVNLGAAAGGQISSHVKTASVTKGISGIVSRTPIIVRTSSGASSSLTVSGAISPLTGNVIFTTTNATAKLDMSATTLNLQDKFVTLTGDGAITLGAVNLGSTGQIQHPSAGQ